MTKYSLNWRSCLITGLVLTLSALTSLSQVIYDNGSLATGATSKSGVAAPTGTQWAEVQNNAGNTTESNTLAGVGCQQIGTTTLNRCADDFVVPFGQMWTISEVRLFAYQTGFAGATSPFIATNIQIWNGRPLAAGSTVIFGDTTTNRLASSTNSNLFRIFNSTTPAPGAAPGTTRIIWQNNVTISPAVVLGPGRYWIDFQMDAGASGNFTPTNTPVGTRGGPFFNGAQKITTATTFADILETGNPGGAPDYGAEFPFKLVGTTTGTFTNHAKALDLNNDSKSDFAIARSTSATTQSSWFILDSAAAQSGVAWGLGVGFASGDKATPADFDGDGKTDVAVWRPGAQGVYYVLQSATNTVRAEPFGQTGDDSSVVGDYNGDGNADLAVYRPGATGIFYYRTTPNGFITFLPWGTTGDIAVPGDYDGDNRYDANIVRNVGGSTQFWRRNSSDAATVITNFGLPTDKFVPGDYDGDGRTDICTVRDEAGTLTWWVRYSSDGGIFRIPWGAAATDYIVQGDYDGDRKTDVALWRSGTGADRGNFLPWATSGPYLTTKWGDSAAPLTAPDYPVANYNVR